MEEKELTSGIITAILIIFLLFATIIIIISLNKANNNAGITVTNTSSETIIFYTSYTQYLNVPNEATCLISSITNSTGGTIPVSNYTINNCVITYIA